MAQKCFPFNSDSGDRVYKAEDFRAYFAQFIGNGVFYANSNALKVVESSGMSVNVNAGAGWIAGAGYINDSVLQLTLANADGALNRIDRVVLRCSYTERDVYVAVKQGSLSAQPTAPALTRNADNYELALADIYVAAGATSIAQQDITDQRLNTTLCGIVTGLIEQADTTDIFNQFEDYLTQFKAQYIADIEEWTSAQESAFTSWSAAQQQEFTDWVETIRDILDEATAGHLQLEIEAAVKDTFERFYGMAEQQTDIKTNGQIVVTNDDGTLTVTKGVDAETGYKTITEVLETTAASSQGAHTYTKVTTFIPEPTATVKKRIREEYSIA